MTSVLKTIQISRKDLAKMSIAMEQLATVTVRDQQVIEEGKPPVTLNPELVDRFQRFKWWAQTNAKTLKDLALKEEQEIYSAADQEACERYRSQRDSIMRAFARRDSRGEPIINQTKDGPSYDIPSKKEPMMLKALDKCNKDHPEILAITNRVKTRLDETIGVRLVCCDFRDIPIVVNGSYMHYFAAILLNTPKLSWANALTGKFKTKK